jgi:hypothetical protein
MECRERAAVDFLMQLSHSKMCTKPVFWNRTRTHQISADIGDGNRLSLKVRPRDSRLSASPSYLSATLLTVSRGAANAIHLDFRRTNLNHLD